MDVEEVEIIEEHPDHLKLPCIFRISWLCKTNAK